MSFAEALTTWIHVTCSSIWVGGSIFLGIVLAPALRSIVPDTENRLLIMIKFGRRFNMIAFPSFIILILTGIYNSRALLSNWNLLETQYGQILLVKIIFVLAIIATYIFHVRRVNKETEEKLKVGKVDECDRTFLRSRIITLGRMTVILSTIVLFLASLLNSGGL
jgi:putative copper resistance protein D